MEEAGPQIVPIIRFTIGMVILIIGLYNIKKVAEVLYFKFYGDAYDHKKMKILNIILLTVLCLFVGLVMGVKFNFRGLPIVLVIVAFHYFFKGKKK